MQIDKNFWHGKKIFLTGHTGFKGSWMSLWLSLLGANVRGYSLGPPTSPSLYEEAEIASLVDSHIGDIRNYDKLCKSMTDFEPDILIHMAAQPLVRYSYNHPRETYEVNVMGTVNVLEIARSCTKLKSIVNITSDKCYENDDRIGGYTENDSMGGYDPYSSSKGCSELVISAYRRSFIQELKIGLASVRAGNVIGGGDWADDRLIPDILRSFEKKKTLLVRYPKATRPWQHVLEPLSGYLILAQKLFENPDKYSQGWNFGPLDKDIKSVDWILKEMSLNWPGSSWNLDVGSNPHEAGILRLDISKAQSELGWRPYWSLDKTLKKIVNWHQSWLNKENMKTVCFSEIEEYMKDMKNEKS